MGELVGPGEPEAWDTSADLVAQQPTTVVSKPLPRQSETTRYLCAATHLDDEFSELVIETLLEQPHRAIAPHYGVDLSAVARHALAARRRRLVRDAALSLLLAVFVALIASRLIDADTRGTLRGWDGDAARALRDLLAAPLLVAVGAWAVVAGELWVRRVRVLPTLTRGQFDPAALRSRFGRRTEARLEEIARSQAGNVVVFSGWNPFVGSGFLVEDWSFAIDVTRGRRDTKTQKREPPEHFDARELHDHMGEALMNVGLPGARVQERLFIDGLDVRGHRELLPNPRGAPRTRVEESVIRRSLQNAESTARTYLCLEATGWHGHLVVTMFFRAVRLKGSLFVEGASFALLPLRNRYFKIDSIQRQGVVESTFSAAAAGVGQTIPLLVASPFRVAAAIRHASATRGRQRRYQSLISEGRVLDYGAATSIRELATGMEHNRYFLRLDHEMYVKVAGERLLQSIGDFLREHGVDTDEFAVHQTNINQSRTINVSAGAGSQLAVAGGSQRVQQRPGGRGAAPPTDRA